MLSQPAKQRREYRCSALWRNLELLRHSRVSQQSSAMDGRGSRDHAMDGVFGTVAFGAKYTMNVLEVLNSRTPHSSGIPFFDSRPPLVIYFPSPSKILE